MVTADEVSDPAALTLVTRLNGEEVRRTGLDRMFFSVPAIITYLSAVTPLLPGDVVATAHPRAAAPPAPRHAGWCPATGSKWRWKGSGCWRISSAGKPTT
ncbi:fumarylacetoacetate hydrolase family protein [Belnapia sp. T18]|uniref:Fumarylacetoacetate hydrolase family protein n=1 Tax=Belnapia arida TaxID=2804533 RepID=A0ABS1U099_9PROT|nr:fumarylacetoacetate hydrolase family protein [Belnapia arida]